MFVGLLISKPPSRTTTDVTKVNNGADSPDGHTGADDTDDMINDDVDAVDVNVKTTAVGIMDTFTADTTDNNEHGRTDVVDNVSNMVDSAFDMVDSAFDMVDSASNMVGYAFNIVYSAFEMVDSASNMVDSASNMVDNAFDMADSAFDIDDSVSDMVDSAYG